MDPKKRAEWERKYRDALQPMVDEPVLAGGVFYRVGGRATVMGPFSGLAALVSRGIGRRRAGGLPSRFLLAVTPTRVHAFACTLTDGDVKAQDELAIWERAQMRVTAEADAGITTVVIEADGDGARLVCSTGKDELSQAVVHTMQERIGVAA